jgi:Mg2+ and Co2+ transporter CorA
MDAVKCSYSFHHLLTSWQCVFKSELSIEDMYRLSHSARMTCVSLQTSISQVAAFHRSFPAARRSDSDEASHFLERLLGEAKPLSGEIQASINTQQQRDQHEETRLAIGESKNTIARKFLLSEPDFRCHRLMTSNSAVTILAFVFIPINTASSIFGMNVTEIGDSASIWVFVIVACALSVCSAIGWFLWRQMGWFKELGQNWGEKFGIRKESEKVGAYI